MKKNRVHDLIEKRKNGMTSGPLGDAVKAAAAEEHADRDEPVTFPDIEQA